MVGFLRMKKPLLRMKHQSETEASMITSTTSYTKMNMERNMTRKAKILLQSRMGLVGASLMRHLQNFQSSQPRVRATRRRSLSKETFLILPLPLWNPSLCPVPATRVTSLPATVQTCPTWATCFHDLRLVKHHGMGVVVLGSSFSVLNL